MKKTAKYVVVKVHCEAYIFIEQNNQCILLTTVLPAKRPREAEENDENVKEIDKGCGRRLISSQYSFPCNKAVSKRKHSLYQG